jgi:hypothetical protein
MWKETRLSRRIDDDNDEGFEVDGDEEEGDDNGDEDE